MPPVPSNPAINLTEALKPRSLWMILKDGFRLYQEEWISFTRPLLIPIVLKLVGTFLAVLLPLFIFETFTEWVFTLRIPVRLFTFFILPLPGIFLLCRGFWLYMVYMASFNVNLVQKLNQGSHFIPDFLPAFHEIPVKNYSKMLLALLAIWVPGITLYIIGLISLVIFSNNIIAAIVIPLICMLGSVLLFLVGTVFAIYFSLAFQVFSLEPEHQEDAIYVLKRSFQLLKHSFWRTLVLLLIMALFTGIIAPFFVTLLLDLLHISHFFMAPALYFVHIMLNSIPVDTIHQLASFGLDIYDEAPSLALDVIHLFTNTIVTLLLLPLGTFIHGLLYLDRRFRVEKGIEKEEEQ